MMTDATTLLTPHPPCLDDESMDAVSGYLEGIRHGASAFVGYLTKTPSEALHQARGFFLSENSLTDKVSHFKSLNKVRTRQRDGRAIEIDREVSGSFLSMPMATDETFLFISRDPSDYVVHGLERLLERARRDLCRMRLTSQELRSTMECFMDRHPGRLVIHKAICRNLDDESTISHEKRTLEEVFEEAESTGRRIHSLTFNFFDTGSGRCVLKAGIARNGHLKFYAGLFSLFSKAIVEVAASIVREKKERLSRPAGGARGEDVKPLRLVFRENVFNDQSGVSSFLQVLSKIRHGDFTIYHRNPYLHASFFDFFDASEFDVFVSDVDSLMVVPQREATVPSLFRFCQEIFERFEEGQILEQEEVAAGSIH